jgi:hypothetical protein
VIFKLKKIAQFFNPCYIVVKGNSILPPGKQISPKANMMRLLEKDNPQVY